MNTPNDSTMGIFEYFEGCESGILTGCEKQDNIWDSSKKLYILKWARACDQKKYPGQSQIFIENEPSIELLRERFATIQQIEPEVEIIYCAEYSFDREISLEECL